MLLGVALAITLLVGLALTRRPPVKAPASTDGVRPVERSLASVTDRDGDGERPLPSVATRPPAAGHARAFTSYSPSVLAGIVVNASGAPVGGARLGLNGPDRGDDGMTTDASGAFRIDVAPGDFRLFAHDDEGWSETLELVVAPGEELAGLVLTLTAGRTIVGSVVDGSGAPVKDATVCAVLSTLSETCAALAESDDHGEFQLPLLPAAPIRLLGESEDGKGTLDVTDARGPVVLRLVDKPLVRGTVIEAASGRPVVAEITATDDEGGQHTATSEPDGHFRLRLDERRRYHVRAAATDAGGLSDEVVVDAASPPADLRLTVMAGASLVGRVVEQSTGRPAMTVVSLLAHDSLEQDVESDATGAYRFRDVRPGRYTILATPREALGTPTGVEVEVRGREEVAVAELRVATAWRLHGRIVDGAHQPVGVHMLLVSSRSSAVARDQILSSNDAGEFEARCVGAVVLRVISDESIGGGTPVDERSGASPVELVLGGGVAVSGVVRGPDGAPRDGVRVACAGEEATSSGGGDFTLDCPPSAGAVTVIAENGGAGERVPIDLRAGRPAFVELHVP